MYAIRSYYVIVPGEMSVREQIAAFSRARIVVSPHGAALANMVFAPPGAVMVELVSTAIQHMSEMRFLCAAAGLHSEWVISSALAESAEAPDTPAMHRDFGVDVDEVLA